jgi:4'-phosphopantetheinyl transferase
MSETPTFRFVAFEELSTLTWPLPLGQVLVCAQSTADLSPDQSAQGSEMLDAKERAQAACFRAERHRLDYIAAHALLRSMLSAASGLPPAAMRFRRFPEGKPVLECPSAHTTDLRFSLSHADGIVACALARDEDVGIDVETIRATETLMETVEAIFTPTERAFLQSVPEAERPHLFFRLWTLKEAFIKATGEGLSRDLQSFSIQLEPLQIIFQAETAPSAAWVFAQTFPTEDSVLSLAVTSAALKLPQTLNKDA